LPVTQTVVDEPVSGLQPARTAVKTGSGQRPEQEPPERPKVVHVDQYLREEDDPYAPRFGF
jgi:hypothetical protein